MSEQLNPNEIQEWQQAIDALVEHEGRDYAQKLLNSVVQYSEQKDGLSIATAQTPYLNTIAPADQMALPDDGLLAIELTNVMRWNAAVMVLRAVKKAKELGGHIASYGGMALLFEVGIEYFFHSEHDGHGGDLVFFQGHSSPGIYARALLEGRISQERADHFRQEINQPGLSSYPHPWLMPDFWQFPTVSMGLGPLMAIYQAQFLKYLDNRGMLDTKGRTVYAFCGDGEMAEVDSTGALNIASREMLNNLVFIIGCNLQGLDGPVFGNGQILQELAGTYKGNGWHVIKVVWGSTWDELFSRPDSNILVQRISELVDGEQQRYASCSVAEFRKDFFGKYPELAAMVADWSDEKLATLVDGGHDIQKVYAAFAEAANYQDGPVVILAKTIKGFGMGASGEGLMGAHQQKSMSYEDLIAMRDRFGLKLSDEQVKNLDYYYLPKDAPAMQYMHEQREKLGGPFPVRREKEDQPLIIPDLSVFDKLLAGSGDREISTTMVYGRCIAELLKDKNIGKHIVPILVDEARTFGMEGLFRQIGVYTPHGQKYTPVDKSQLMYYKESTSGQLLQQGLSEASGMACWIAAATSYSNNNMPMIPFYAYYSMFGFQRFGDMVWAAGDSRAKGFICGGTSGRTTLAGEGLQHQDGHNLLMFDMVPNCHTYDPTFGYELAVIIHHGMKRMYEKQEDVFYYITMLNENYIQPSMPADSEEGIIKGMYLFKPNDKAQIQLLGSGSILTEVLKAADILKNDFNIESNIWSVPSFAEVAHDLRETNRDNRMHPENAPKESYVSQCLNKTAGPVLAATDYINLNAEQIRGGIDKPYYVLGTDGFGRSATRQNLREFFEVNANYIAYSALYALTEAGEFDKSALLKAREQLNIDPNHPDPVYS